MIRIKLKESSLRNTRFYMQNNPLEIQLYPSPLLKKKCRKVEKVDAETQKILDDMLALMRKHRGIGLAANQAGLDLSLVVMEADDKIYKLINPKITKKKGKKRIRKPKMPARIKSTPRARQK